MRKFFTLLVTLFLLSMSLCLAQDTDSLKRSLKQHPHNDTIRADLLNSLCHSYWHTSYDSALHFGNAALSLSQSLKYHAGVEGALNTLGVAHFFDGNYKLAEEFHHKAVAYAELHNLDKLIATALNSLASAQHLQGNYASAIENYLRALKIEEDEKDTLAIVKVLANTGSVYQELQNTDNALLYHFKAYELINKLKNLSGYKVQLANRYRAYITDNIGTIYSQQKRYTDGLTYHKIALKADSVLGDQVAITRSLGNIGTCLLLLNRVEESAPYFERAYALSKTLNDRQTLGIALLDLSELRVKQKRPQEAINYAKESLPIFRELNALPHLLGGYLDVGAAYAAAKNYEKAYFYNEKAYELNDSLRGREVTDKVVQLQKGYELAKKQSEINQLSEQRQIKELELARERLLKYILIGGLFVSVVITVVAYRGLRMIRKQKEIIESINDDLQSQALMARMNPHFIFNALNSIQHLIFKKNTEAAFHYLQRFSQLLRGILDNSEKQWTSIKQESEALQHYIELESLHIEGDFTYEVSRNGSDAFDNYLIPLMIVQPFVENAILHGLRNKQGAKKLAVTFSKENENIICHVTDNGIGRKAAHENKYKRLTMVESKGIKLTEQRMKVLKATTRRNFFVEIVDLYDNDRPSGTKIILTFAHA